MLCDQCSPSFKALAKLKAARPRDRMRANELPQREELRTLSKVASEELSLYDKELARLRFLIRYVQSQKQELQREMLLLDSLNAPIRLLPPEILGKIFEYYVDAAGGNSFGHGAKATVPAAVLATVCKHWHTIVCHSARLWSRISIRFGSEHNIAESYLSTIIGRSITAHGSRTPLRIHMSTDTNASLKRNDHNILKAITKECDRWSTLIIGEMESRFAMSKLLQQIKGHLDQLWCLDIQHISEGQTLSMFSEAPKLRTLHLDMLHRMPQAKVPLSQIKIMSARLWQAVNIKYELNFCKDVTNLTVNLAENFLVDPLESSRFVLQCRELTLDASDYSAPRHRSSEIGLYAGIQCPNLNTLILLESDNSQRTSPFSIYGLHPFLIASGQKLRTLHITSFPLNDVNELITAFAAMPVLETLLITESCPPCCLNCNGGMDESDLESQADRENCLGRSILDADLLHALTVIRSDGFESKANAQVLLPKMKTLLLTASRTQGDFEFSLLADMLYSRYFAEEDLGLVKLEKVKLAFPGMRMEASDIDMFRWLCKVGVDLTMYDKDRRVELS